MAATPKHDALKSAAVGSDDDARAARMSLGIVAGGGSLPREAAEAVLKRGGNVHIAAVTDAADDDFSDLPHTSVYWSALGKTLSAFRDAGVENVLFLGRMFRPRLATARPDGTFLAALPEVVRLLRQGGDDALLRALIGIFEKRGFRVVGIRDCAPEVLVGEGALGQIAPDADHDADIALGMQVIATLGRFDIGQAVVCCGGQVMAIEGAEGTDRMLARVAKQFGEHGDARGAGVLIKRPKPGQDLRVDLPAIGPDTVAGAKAAGLAGIAVMADHVIVAGRVATQEAADRSGLFVAGINQHTFGVAPQRAAHDNDMRFDSVVNNAVAQPNKPSLDDARLGVAVMRAMQPFAQVSAVTVRRGRVIAVGVADGVKDVLSRTWPGRYGGALVLGDDVRETRDIAMAAKRSGLAVIAGSSIDLEAGSSVSPVPLLKVRMPDDARMSGGVEKNQSRSTSIFVVAGEHSGDALGARLIGALRTRLGNDVSFAGVGGDEMAAQGVPSLYPMSDVAVMGPAAILSALPLIYRRVHETVDAIVAANPDALVIIDSPEFTHPIAKRVRRRAPHIPIIDYVSPSVWAWRPGRAKRMRRYVDLVLGLLPFEPAAHRRLGGPACVYVGHPLSERIDEIRGADADGLRARLGLSADQPVLLVLPGSRRSEVTHLIDVFGETVADVARQMPNLAVVIPAVPHVRDMIAARTQSWSVKPHIIGASHEKFAAMKLARAALAASGTVTLELAIANTPTVVAYRVDRIMVPLRFLLKVESVVLTNLVLSKNVYPEFLQERCTAADMAPAVRALLEDTPARRAQCDALAETANRLAVDADSPSLAAADAVIGCLSRKD